MPSYFTSDVHLRLDRPERGRRFASWVESLEADDRLTIVGDLCDFWFAARQYQTPLEACEGLKALAEFRSRGGQLTIMPGNHDGLLGTFYENKLGAKFVQEPLTVQDQGLRLCMLHGQWLGGHPAWKGLMESRAFLSAFRRIPSPLASSLDQRLERRNDKERNLDDMRQLVAYRQYVKSCAGTADVVIIGHIHRSFDDAESSPRLIVPGGWFGQSSYVRVDSAGATLCVEKDPTSVTC